MQTHYATDGRDIVVWRPCLAKHWVRRTPRGKRWETPRIAHADLIWWQVVRRRWSTPLEQPI